MLHLDRLDVEILSKIMNALRDLNELGGVTVKTITFEVYGHRLRASKRSRYSPLAITKIEPC